MRRFALVIALVACRPPAPVEVAATPSAGISIALYQLHDQSYAVVDDRRVVDVRDGVLVLDRIDPGAALPTLVLEPLASRELVVGACTRDIVELAPGTVAPSSVRCAVTGPDGQHLVRVLYVSNTLAYGAQHELSMTAADKALLTTRYAIATRAWGGKADVVLFDGMPGREQAPVEIARGTIVLDGSVAILATPTQTIDARLRRVFGGEAWSDSDEDDVVPASAHAVWVWLELFVPRIASGPMRASVRVDDEDNDDNDDNGDNAVRIVDVPLAFREQGARALRLPLWIDPALRGSNVRRRVGRAGADLAEWFSVVISNTGTKDREVWIEQNLQQGARRRVVTYGQPRKPTLGKTRARAKVRVPAQQSSRMSFTITYTY